MCYFGRCNLKDAVAFSYGCLLGRPASFDSGSIAGKDNVVDQQMKKHAQVIQNGSKPDKSPHPAHDQELAGTPTQYNERPIEDSGMGGCGMGLQSADILEDWFVSSLEIYLLY